MYKAAKLLAIAAVVLTVLSTASFVYEVDATADTWDGETINTDWYDKEQNKYTLDSAADLAGLAAITNGTADGIARDSFNYKDVYLTVDVDLGGHDWTPIGYSSTEIIYFYGNFYAGESTNGVTISNLKVNLDDDDAVAGLFGRLEGTVRGITLENPQISTVHGNAGALAGSRINIINDSVTDCHVTGGTIKSTGNAGVGGLIGSNSNSGLIENCTVKNTTITSADGYVGGITGSTSAHSAPESGTEIKTGWIVDCTVENCTITTNKSTWASSSVAGGISGMTTTSADAVENVQARIDGCVVQSTVITGNESAVGGISGRTNNDVLITGCEYRGKASESADLTGRYAGGIVGYASVNPTITLCRTIDATLSGTNEYYEVAGIVAEIGSPSDYSISNSYVSGMRVTDSTESATYTVGVRSVNSVIEYFETTNVTYINADPDYKGWKEDGTNSAIIAHNGNDGSIDYYYGSIEDYIKDNPDKTSAELINGARFDNDANVEITLTMQSGTTATVPSDVTLNFSSNELLPTSGQFSIEGVIVIPETLAETSLSFSGTGYLVIEDATYTTSMASSDVELGWYYSSTSPYQISTANDLKGLAVLVNEQRFSFEGETVELNADIYLNNMDWAPIGSYINKYGFTDNPIFKGTFEGNGHKVSNLYVNKPDQQGVGLFGAITVGTVKDLTVENAEVKGMMFVGAVVGWFGDTKAASQNQSIVNCHVTGTIDIEGNYIVGGLVGRSAAGLEDCSVDATGTVTGTYVEGKTDCEGDNVGGLVGYVEEPAGTAAITNCSVTGIDITGTIKVGGMVGALNAQCIVTDCSVDSLSVSSNATQDYIESKKSSNTTAIGGLIGTTNASGTGISIVKCDVSTVALNPQENMTAGYVSGLSRGTSAPPAINAVEVAPDCTGSNSVLPDGAEIGSDEPVSPPSGWDDEELPPFIPPQDSGDDTVTIVACAAAAVVAALMAVFLILTYRKD